MLGRLVRMGGWGWEDGDLEWGSTLASVVVSQGLRGVVMVGLFEMFWV